MSLSRKTSIDSCRGGFKLQVGARKELVRGGWGLVLKDQRRPVKGKKGRGEAGYLKRHLGISSEGGFRHTPVAALA